MNVAIIGAGLTGSSAARKLADNGHTVTIFEKEFGQYGGSCADLEVADGIYMSKYGPHIFHTNNEQAYEFACRFTTMLARNHIVSALTDKGVLPWPINDASLRGVFGKLTTKEAKEAWSDDIDITRQILDSGEEADNFETAAMRIVGGEVYRTFIKGYTESQWMCKASELPSGLFGRIRVTDGESRSFFDDKYVCLPAYGYSNMCKLMLDHPAITIQWGKVTFEELFPLVYGFDMVINTAPTNDLLETAPILPFGRIKFHYNSGLSLQPFGAAVVNVNKGGKYTRYTDYSKLWGKDYNKAMTCTEEPHVDGVPLYTIRTKRNIVMADQQIANLMKMSVISTGRMGGYKYVNMDQAIILGLEAADRVMGGVK